MERHILLHLKLYLEMIFFVIFYCWSSKGSCAFKVEIEIIGLSQRISIMQMIVYLLMQAISFIRTLYAFTNETLAKYSYATSLQATLRYGILISLVQGLGLGFTYGLAICSCALQLWVGRFLVSHGKANGGEIIIALFAVILSGL